MLSRTLETSHASPVSRRERRLQAALATLTHGKLDLQRVSSEEGVDLAGGEVVGVAGLRVDIVEGLDTLRRLRWEGGVASSGGDGSGRRSHWGSGRLEGLRFLLEKTRRETL